MAPSRATKPENEELLPTRASMLDRLRSWEDQASWRDFFDTYWKFIYGVAIRSGLSASEAEDDSRCTSTVERVPDAAAMDQQDAAWDARSND